MLCYILMMRLSIFFKPIVTHRSKILYVEDIDTHRKFVLKNSQSITREHDNLLAIQSCNRSQSLAFPHLLSFKKQQYVALELLEQYIPKATHPVHTDRQAADLLMPYFEAVHDLHTNSSIISHCDIKFTNFMRHPVTKDVTLIDFGCAAFTDASTSECDADIHRGSPYNRSPEIFQHRVHQHTDTWALGIMLYQALHPEIHPLEVFNKGLILSSIDFRRAIQNIPYNHFSMWTNYDAPLCSDLICRMLIQDPEERFSVDESISFLRWIQSKT
ncbi:serine/threonine-protein kinase [Tetraselmis virus 1]|uniref:Serine/threonine-protein kinase n=1 Tax=Tetraselmis virus 1 TaxID=2060617 RepID=A0A2P0VNX6_9VIRU|nr:serine/threonine-protein kinase [Tetraselmis virus 1]AUF82616.1 serine/threonine-protein kinase [Tetraselmis virus 1]